MSTPQDGDVVSGWYRRTSLHTKAADGRMKIVNALHDAGARLLAGTGFAGYFLVPGYSSHEELQALVTAGVITADRLDLGAVLTERSISDRAARATRRP